MILREKQGRKVVYHEIQVPTDEEMGHIAAELHAARNPALRDVMGWRVLYMPSFPVRYTTHRVDPFTGQSLSEPEQHESHLVSYCTFGYGQAWSVTLSWANGDDQPPVKCNQRGDVVHGKSVSVQGSLFAGIPVRNDADFVEGARLRTESNVYERNPEARRQCLNYHGTKCTVCQFDFEAAFGGFARGFIHVHHVRPLATIGCEYCVDPIHDLIPVCPNCHAALHIREPAMTPDELRAVLTKRKDA
jgi:hypothetical protein